jgi:PPOX class probable F420-dependent enzyme
MLDATASPARKPTAMADNVIPQSHHDILEQPAIAHLASLGPRGEPQSHPVWFLWDEGKVKISTTTERQKFANIDRDRRVSVSILDSEDPYRYVEIRGRVVEIDEDPDEDFIDRLAQRYIDADEYPNKQPGAERVVIHLEPEHAATMG